MPCPHNEITIVQRSQRQSAVAAAAYQSGEKLFCGYDQEVKHYPEKRGKTDCYEKRENRYGTRFLLSRQVFILRKRAAALASILVQQPSL